MTVTAAFCPLSLQPLRDANDNRIVGGKIFVYAAGTTDLVTTFADAGLSAANPNPLVSDGFGRIPPVYVGLGAYKLVAQDAQGAQLFVVDDLPGGVDYVAQATAAAQQAGSTLAQAQTGDVKAKACAGLDAGWLVLNGKTIGNGQTGATARANDDTKALYIYLWNGMSSLAVSGGRGVTASADFSAGKTLALPDWRGRVPCGCDQMGADAAAGVLSAASTGTPDLPGAVLGADTIALAQTHLPAVSPTITVSGDGKHGHAAVTDTQGAHNHTGNTGQAGSHNHPYSRSNDSNTSTAGGGGLANSGLSTANTATLPDHAHSISTDGAHAHAVTLDGGQPGGGHTHAATIEPLGDGQAHPNMPPAVLGYWHIKL